MSERSTYQADEVSQFDDIGGEWWDPKGPFKALHWINGPRLQYIDEQTHLTGKQVLDVGCGGGLLSEGLAKRGAVVTGLDASERAIETARAHADASGLTINYNCELMEVHAESHQNHYDVITCLELIEHVADERLLVDAIFQALKPGGLAFFSTLNRTPLSYLTAILGAEYCLNWVPKGTHDYQKFIKPSEMRQLLIASGFRVTSIEGLNFNPLTLGFQLGGPPLVNYILHAEKPGA